jgi:hypothetical protein
VLAEKICDEALEIALVAGLGEFGLKNLGTIPYRG